MENLLFNSRWSGGCSDFEFKGCGGCLNKEDFVKEIEYRKFDCDKMWNMKIG